MSMRAILIGWLLLFVLSACQQQKKFTGFDEAYVPYIAAFTTGSISKVGEVTVELTTNVVGADEIGSDAGNLLTVSGGAKGSASWADRRTIVFTPTEAFTPGDQLTATLRLGDIMQVPDSLALFTFPVFITEQYIQVEIEAIVNASASNWDVKQVQGRVLSADVADPEEIQEAFTATYNGAEVAISWAHEGNRKSHLFTIEGLQRGDQDRELVLAWDKKPLGLAEGGTASAIIPSFETFEVSAVRVQQAPDQRITIEFSDPLEAGQNLAGLVVIEGINTTYSIEVNQIHLYPGTQTSGEYPLTVHQGIRNARGKALEKTFTQLVQLEELKPAVRLVGHGTIMPGSQGLVFPFEAVNLSKVDVTIIKVYADNVLQFLQVNNLEGKDEIQRVGNVLVETTVPLEPTDPSAQHRWTRYGIQLEKYINAEPGAIYHVGLSFRPSYSLYSCGSDAALQDPELDYPYMDTRWDQYEQYGYSNWDYWSSYWYGEDYSWADRDNPCRTAYYRRDRFVGRNVLASDIGLVAKLANDGTLLATASSVTTTRPLGNIVITAYDFQLQPISTLRTNAEGQIQTILKDKPFALVAESNGRYGYLKMADGNALSVSRFDVAGATYEDGVKAFLFGERGVWRPGDSIYLQMVVEDPENTLPANLPVQMTLTDPRGTVVSKTVHRPTATSWYDLRFATAEEAPTGTWTASVKVGGSTFYKRLKVETIKPNRLKIDLTTGEMEAGSDEVSLQLASRWLHGAIAGPLKYTIEGQLKAAGTRFANYGDFRFDDPSIRFYMEPAMLADDKLDARGEASITAAISEYGQAPGKLALHLTTQVFEPGGDMSVDRMSIPFDPYEAYVGIRIPKGDRSYNMLLTDKEHQVQLVALTPTGKPLADRQLEVAIYKLDYSWWWEQEGEGHVADYFSRSYARPIHRAAVTTNQKGEANYPLRINYPEWGMYLVSVTDEAGGHTTGATTFIDWPGWAGRARGERPGGAAMLSFSSDKPDYKIGDNMRLTVPSSAGGRLWVSLETGNTVVRQFWVNTDDEQTIIDIPATAAMTPTVYAHVTLIQPHAQTANDLPIRLYGIIPLQVEDPTTHLQPVLTTAAEWRPETTATVKVSEEQGRPMRYVVAVVDEGLLDLTRFTTPSPWSYFYARQALGVRTWDMYDQVLGAFGGRMEQLLSVGGDEALQTTGSNRANRFPPMVRFVGPFTLRRGQTAEHRIDVPSYVGSVRTMVIAAGDDGNYGDADKVVPVRKPLMVLATVPRVLGPQEQLTVPVSVFSMKESQRQATVDIKVTGPLTIVGASKKAVNFNGMGEQLIAFEAEVGDYTGWATIEITASSGQESAKQTIQVPVRSPNPVSTLRQTATLQVGESMNLSLSPVGMKGTNSGQLELTAIPPLHLSSRLQYLIGYPHGCVEQTTSKAFPQLFVQDLVRLQPEQVEKLEANVKTAIAKLNSFQQANGGLSYWPGLNTVDDWSSVYAGHFMLEAKARGYELPYGFLDKWLGYMQNTANQWVHTGNSNYSYSSEMIQAYRLYVLALAGKASLAAMNRLKAQPGLSARAKWRLAGAYSLAGQQSVALELARGLDITFPEERSYHTYGSAMRDKAMVLEVMVALGLQQLALPLVNELSQQMASNKVYSTQTTAYSLLALSRYAASKAGQVAATWTIGRERKQVRDDKPIHLADLSEAQLGGGTLQVTNNQQVPLYVILQRSGQPLPGNEVSFNRKVELRVVYRNREGQPLDVRSLPQGQSFTAEITVTNTTQQQIQNLALTYGVPSGWEITTGRLDDLSLGSAATTPTYSDIRDDKVLYYFNLNAGAKAVFRVGLLAAYAGRYYLPATLAEAMYDMEVAAQDAGQWIVVTPATDNLP